MGRVQSTTWERSTRTGRIALWIMVLGFCYPAIGQAEQPTDWPQPRALNEQLESIAEFQATAAWSRTTLQLISFVTDGSLEPSQRLASLQQLAKQRDQISTLLNQLQQSQIPQERFSEIYNHLVRIHYRLSRRIAVWDALLRIPVRESIGDSSSRVQQASYGNIEFSQLPEGWVEFLRLDEFKSAFGSLNPDPELQRKTARRILARIYSPALGEKQSEFVQRAIDQQVIDFLKEHASEPIDPVDVLKRLEYYESKPGNRSSHVLNDRYQDLLWSDVQADNALAEILDAHYRNANFRMAISSEFMNRLLPKLPTIAEPVSETIQGALVSGSSQVSNQIQVNLVPDPERLNFQIQTDGQVHSDTVARTKGFRILNQGLAQFQVTKQITVDDNGIDGSRKATADTSAHQLLVGVQSKLDHMPMLGNIARKMAEKRVREQAPESNQIFRRKVTRSAVERVESEMSQQIAKVEAAATENLLQPLLALELDPEPLQLATTPERIVMRYRLAGRDQMAANTARPQETGNSLLSFQVHQSLINNAIARLELGGETFNSDSLAEHLQQKLGLEKKPLANGDKEDRDAEFTFDKFDPIKIDFVDNRMLITLNFDELNVAGKTTLRKVPMTVGYAITTDGLKVHLHQDETRKVLGTARHRFGEKAAISVVMNVLFDEHYELDALPAKFRNYPQARSLTVSQLVIDDGWMGVALDDPQPARQAESDPDADDPRLGSNIRKLLDRR